MKFKPTYGQGLVFFAACIYISSIIAQVNLWPAVCLFLVSCCVVMDERNDVKSGHASSLVALHNSNAKLQAEVEVLGSRVEAIMKNNAEVHKLADETKQMLNNTKLVSSLRRQ